MPITPDLISAFALFVSLIALFLSWRAHENSKDVRRQNLRIEVRQLIDDAVHRADALPRQLEDFQSQTTGHLVRVSMTNSGYAEILKTERQELADNVQLLVPELKSLDTDLTRKSPKQLEQAMTDAKRLTREIGSVEAAIEDRLARFEESEERGDKARQRFHEDVERKTPLGGMFGKK